MLVVFEKKNLISIIWNNCFVFEYIKKIQKYSFDGKAAFSATLL